MTGSLEAVGELAYERRMLHRYDPWWDLRRLHGVDLRWHNKSTRFGNSKFTGEVLGLTTFGELAVSLQVGLGEAQLRSALAHEIAHLDRGPLGEGRVSVDEAATDLMAAQRLIDPVVFDALMEATRGEVTDRVRDRVLRVDRSLLKRYSKWRSRVKPATANRAWEKSKELPAWPAPWVQEYPRLMRFATQEAASTK